MEKRGWLAQITVGVSSLMFEVWRSLFSPSPRRSAKRLDRNYDHTERLLGIWLARDNTPKSLKHRNYDEKTVLPGTCAASHPDRHRVHIWNVVNEAARPARS